MKPSNTNHEQKSGPDLAFLEQKTVNSDLNKNPIPGPDLAWLEEMSKNRPSNKNMEKIRAELFGNFDKMLENLPKQNSSVEPKEVKDPREIDPKHNVALERAINGEKDSLIRYGLQTGILSFKDYSAEQNKKTSSRTPKNG